MAMGFNSAFKGLKRKLNGVNQKMELQQTVENGGRHVYC
jgi:hypothetical protein